MNHIKKILKKNHVLFAVYLSSLFFAFHGFFVLYSNSPFLNTFFSDQQIGYLYIVGATINLVLLVNVSKIIKKIGSYYLMVLLITLEFIAVLGLAIAPSILIVALLFILYRILTPFILYMLDIFLESVSSDEKTGGIRSVYLTLANVTAVIAPVLAGLVISKDGFKAVYLLSAILILPLFYFIDKEFRHYVDPIHPNVKIIDTLKTFLGDQNIKNIFNAQLLLQIYYAWMVIYMPIYLHTNLGFSFSQTGLIFTVMLIPFVLIEIPTGYLADTRFGEKEFLMIGFVLLGFSTFFIPFLTEHSVFLWALLLFSTRIGASFIEITTESYFFKHVTNENIDTIGFFRITRPLSYIIAPIVASATFYVVSFGYSFAILGLLMLWGIKNAYMIVDTR